MSLVHFKLTAMVSAAISSSGHVHQRPTTSTLNKMKNLMKLPTCCPLRRRINLKRKGFGNKSNAGQPLEEDEIVKIWSTRALGLQNPRSQFLLFDGTMSRTLAMSRTLNNVTHLRQCHAPKETKEVRGKVPESTTTAYSNKIWKTDGGERDPYRAFIEYVAHRAKGENVSEEFFSLHWTNQHQTFGIFKSSSRW